MNGDTVSSVSPGIGAFLAFFALAIALWLLMRNMNSRMRRMSYRAEEAQREADAAAEAKGKAKVARRPAGEKDVTPAAEDEVSGDDQTGGRPTQP